MEGKRGEQRAAQVLVYQTNISLFHLFLLKVGHNSKTLFLIAQLFILLMLLESSQSWAYNITVYCHGNEHEVIKAEL